MVIRLVITTAVFLSSASLAAAPVGPAPVGSSSIGSAEWSLKVEGLVRSELRQEHGLEAWRVLQVAHRTRTFNSDWRDYERLAIFQAGGCPLAIEPNDEARAHLLAAAVFRFNPNFYQESLNVPLEHDLSQTALAVGLTHYLRDIPEAEIRKDSGCRFAKILARREKSPARNELQDLRYFLGTLPTEDHSKVGLLVTLRALELATSSDINDNGLAASLRERLPAPEKIPWTEFPDPERQWLFTQIFKAKRISEVSQPMKTQVENLAKEALNGKDASPLWISMIDFEKENARERARLLSKVEKLGEFKARGWLLFQLAQARYETGGVIGCLTVLRRLLVEHEEPISEDVEDASVNLASLVFAENRLDKTNLGAIETALPARLWNTFFKKAEIRSAIAGQVTEFKTLESLRRHRAGRDFGAEEETPLLQALAQRNLKSFEHELNTSSYGANRSLFALARSIAAEIVGESGKGKKFSAQAYADAIARKLQSLKFVNNEEERSDLVQILTTHSADRDGAINAARSVRQGLLTLGTARAEGSGLRPEDLALTPPSILPRRDLYFVPDPQASHGWIFSTAIR